MNLLLIISLAGICSCGKPVIVHEKPLEPSPLSLGVQSLSFAWAQSEKTVPVVSDLPWSILEPSAGWVHIKTASGGKALTVSVDENLSSSPREANLLVWSADSECTLSISQEGWDGAGNYNFTENAVPAQWEFNASVAGASPWVTGHTAPAHLGTGRDKAFISFETGSSDHSVTYSVSSNSIAVTNALSGDAFTFSVPIKYLPAGTTVDFMATVGVSGAAGPKYWIFEYLEDRTWKSVEGSLKTASENPSVKYSFYTKYFSTYQYATIVQSFTLARPVKDNYLQMRIRIAGDISSSGGKLSAGHGTYVWLVGNNANYVNCSINAYEGIPVKDTRKVAVIGNSFSSYFGTYFMLKQLARSQGHEMVMRVHAKGSQTFGLHLTREFTQQVWAEGGYDYVFLQDQSRSHYDYYTLKTPALKEDTKTIAANFKAKSPSATIFLENTWPFYKNEGDGVWMGAGNIQAAEAAMLSGCKEIAEYAGTSVSPIGVAFRTAYEEGITSLWYTDNKHPNRNGSYLKTCVNYLCIYGTRFDSNAADCGVDHELAVRLRDVAERVVLGHEGEYGITRQ